MIDTLAVDGWAVTNLVHRGGPGWAAKPSSPLHAVPNVTAHLTIGTLFNSSKFSINLSGNFVKQRKHVDLPLNLRNTYLYTPDPL